MYKACVGWLRLAWLGLALVLGRGAERSFAREPAPRERRTEHSTQPQLPSGEGARAPTRFQMRHVNFRVDDGIILQIDNLSGQLLPHRPDKPPTFDDRESMVMVVDGGEAAMSTDSFSQLLNRYVFSYPGTPLTDIQVSADGDRIRQVAVMHKGVSVPTEMVGSVSALPDGRIRFHTESIKAGGVPSKGLMDVMGLQVNKLIKGPGPRGVTIVGDDIIMDLNLMIPPPRVRARVIKVWVDGDRIVQRFGPRDGTAPMPILTPPDPAAANYMYFRGGTIRFARLTMTDADLQLVDAHPENPLDFALSHYVDQLAAGYSKTTLNGAQITVIPDYRQVRGKDTKPDLLPPNLPQNEPDPPEGVTDTGAGTR